MREKPITVTIRSEKCITYLRERKEHGLPFSATITDILLSYLEDRENRSKEHIHIYMRSDGQLTTQPAGTPRFEGKIPTGSAPKIDIPRLNDEIKRFFEEGKKLKKVPESQLRHTQNK